MNKTEAVVRDNAQAGRFEMQTEAGLAFVSYRQAGDVVSLDHAEVPPSLRGSGAASKLVLGVFDLLRTSKRTMIPRCGYVRSMAQRHPEYADLLAA